MRPIFWPIQLLYIQYAFHKKLELWVLMAYPIMCSKKCDILEVPQNGGNFGSHDLTILGMMIVAMRKMTKIDACIDIK